MNRLLPFVLIGFVVMQSCKSAKTGTTDSEDLKAIYIYQNGKETAIKEQTAAVAVKPEQFSIRFYNKKYDGDQKEYYAAQVAAFLDESEWSKIQTGMAKADTKCFAPGTGMAPGKSGKYELLIFNKYGHHYLTYGNPDSKRLNLVSQAGDNLKLAFDVYGLYYDNTKTNMAETTLQQFYLAILIDRNLNGEIDGGEFKKLIVKIK